MMDFSSLFFSRHSIPPSLILSLFLSLSLSLSCFFIFLSMSFYFVPRFSFLFLSLFPSLFVLSISFSLSLSFIFLFFFFVFLSPFFLPFSIPPLSLSLSHNVLLSFSLSLPPPSKFFSFSFRPFLSFYVSFLFCFKVCMLYNYILVRANNFLCFCLRKCLQREKCVTVFGFGHCTWRSAPVLCIQKLFPFYSTCVHHCGSGFLHMVFHLFRKIINPEQN